MENIMLQDEKKEWIKIIDFGLSNIYDEKNPLKTLCGSPEYAAPELFVKGKKYGPEVDLWSFGVILYVMGTGRLPFTSPRDESTSADERRRRLMLQINRGLSAPQERLIVTLSAEYKNLLRLALMPAAHKRIHLDELRRHPWMSDTLANSNTDKLQLCLAERQAIIRQVAAIVSMDCRHLKMDICKRRFGNIAGIYNIMSHKMQLHKLKRSNEFKSLRTPQILQHNCQKSRYIRGTSCFTSNTGTFSIIKPNCSSDQTIKNTQPAFMQTKVLKKDFQRVTADPKYNLEKTKKKCETTAIQPTSKKITHSISTQVRSNKIHDTKENSMRKVTKDPIKSVKKYSTIRLGKNSTIKRSNTSDPERTVPKSHD